MLKLTRMPAGASRDCGTPRALRALQPPPRWSGSLGGSLFVPLRHRRSTGAAVGCHARKIEPWVVCPAIRHDSQSTIHASCFTLGRSTCSTVQFGNVRSGRAEAPAKPRFAGASGYDASRFTRSKCPEGTMECSRWIYPLGNGSPPICALTGRGQVPPSSLQGANCLVFPTGWTSCYVVRNITESLK